MKFPAKTRRFLEVSANIAILVVACLVVGNFIWSKWQAKKQLRGSIVGSTVSIPGVNSNNGRTLVLALQQGCRYCEASASFYRRLHDLRSGDEPRMVAVIPGETTEVARYLSAQGVIVDDIINLSLADIKVSATPTLLLVDRTGRVSDVWVGKMDSQKETEVAQRIIDSP